jgi:2-polyprenyl-3-methyl-5-hydroxy-6-metoxy-1,4-benzoquinol methylase
MKVNLPCCKLCSSIELEEIIVRDWLYGGSASYTYYECRVCGTLALNENSFPVGIDLYDENYGSFIPNRENRFFLFGLLRSLRNRIVLLHPESLVANLLNYLRPLPFEFMAISGFAKRGSRILDVGCGMGKYLMELRSAGFENLQGLDPFLGSDIKVENGVTLKKGRIEDVSDEFDVIISHHSLEHSEDPLAMIKAMARNLALGGHLIITVPVLGKLYKRFKGFSYIIQAPQHTVLYTVDGLVHLAKLADLELVAMSRGKEFEGDWLKFSQSWMSKGLNGDDDRRDEIANDLQGPGDNVTFVFKVR